MLEINDLFFSLVAVRPSFPGSSPRASGDDAAGRAGRDPQREEIRTYFEGGDALAWAAGRRKAMVPRQKFTTKSTDTRRMIRARQLSGST